MEPLHRSLRSDFILHIYQTHRGAKGRNGPHTLASLSFVGSLWGISHTSDAPAGKPLPIKENPQGGRGRGMREHAPCYTASLLTAVSQSSLCRNQNDPPRDRPLSSSFLPSALQVTDSIFSGVHTARGGGGEGSRFFSDVQTPPVFTEDLGRG